MNKKFQQLKESLAAVHDIHSVLVALEWDQQTYMPREGAEERAAQIGTLSELAHRQFTAKKIGDLLHELTPWADSLDSESDEACLIRTATREYERKTQVPARLVAEFARTTATAQNVWEQALHENDFARFRPHLEKIFRLRREYADCFKPYDHVYDPLLDEFEPGLKTADVLKIFRKIRPLQTSLIRDLAARPQIDNSFLFRRYPDKQQWRFGVDILSRMGFDWNRGRQDRAVHPFTDTFGLGDIRITTHIHVNNLASGLFSSMHEGGHALYEQGVDRGLSRTLLGTGASLAIHESQSRLWENLVGRSHDFWTWAYPLLKKRFPAQLADISLDKFYRGINRVAPSFIRTESDEATYNLHIMLRLELEIGVLEGKIEVKDLPELWREKMRDYLGVVPDTDAQGVLQDVHWACGIIGYFPTYALGNLISAQIWQAASAELDLPHLLRHGELLPLREWLRENLHRYGSKFAPQDLVKRVTGHKIDPQPYMDYLNRKYRAIYGA